MISFLSKWWFKRFFFRQRRRSQQAQAVSTQRFRPSLEALEERIVPSTFVWIGPVGGDFSNPNNWSNDGYPGVPGMSETPDDLVFPMSSSVTPGAITNDIASDPTFNSMTFLSNGWTINGQGFTISDAINDTTATAGTNTINASVATEGNQTFIDDETLTTQVAINIANPSSGGTPNQLLLNGGLYSGGGGLLISGAGNLTINGLDDAEFESVAFDGPGTVTLTGVGTSYSTLYSGGLTINGGTVAIDNAMALGAGGVTVYGGTLQLDASGVANAVNLDGGDLSTTGDFSFDGPLGTTSTGPPGFGTTSSAIDVGDHTLTLAGAGGNTTGSISRDSVYGNGSLTVVGANGGVLQDFDAGTYDGVTNIIGATFVLGSPASGQAGGQNTETTGYVVSQGGTLEIDSSQQVTNNRLGASAFVELDGGALDVNPNGGNSSTESFAALNLGDAAGIIGSNTVNLGANNNTVTVGTLNCFPGSTVTFVGANIGSTNTIKFNAFGSSSGLVNGILPFADLGTTAPATNFATYGVNGIAIAASIAAPVANGGAGNGTENIKLTSNLTLSQDTFVNSLNLNGYSVNLGNFRLIIGSGGLLQTSVNDATITGNGTANSRLVFGTTTTPATTPFPANGSLTPVEGIITVADAGLLTLTTASIAVGNNLTINANPTGGGGSLQITGAPASSAYTGTTWVTSGTIELDASTSANIIPTTLVIGDNAGGTDSDSVEVVSNFQQIGTTATPGNVVINSTGLLSLQSSETQSIGTLTMLSGLSESSVSLANLSVLTVTGTITSGGVVLAPAASLPGGIPSVSYYQPSLIASSGTLILAPNGVASGTATFNVGNTAALVNGGEEDLIVSATIGAGSAKLDKTGAGVLVISTNPVGYTGTVQVDAGTFAPGVANFNRPIVVNNSGSLGNDSVAGGSTAAAITVNSGGAVEPGLPAAPSQELANKAVFTNTGPINFSNGGVLTLKISGYGGAGVDSDQFVGSTGANQVTLGGTSVLKLDLNGLASNGTLSGANSPFTWANALIGAFSDAPNPSGPNILPAADLLNNPLGFQALVTYNAGSITVTLRQPNAIQSPEGMAAADIIGNGYVDLITTSSTGNSVSVQGSSVIGNTFQVGFDPTAVAVGDINGDGRPDLVVANSGSDTVSVLLNTSGIPTNPPYPTEPGSPTDIPSASFAAQLTFAVGVDPTAVDLADINGDGRLDIIVLNSGSNSFGVLLNVTPNGASTASFAPMVTFATGVDPLGSIAVGDINGDGLPDVAVANSGSNSVGVFLNATPVGSYTVSFHSQQTFATGAGPAYVTMADINGDGRPDLAVSNYDGGAGTTISVLLNTTSAGAGAASFAQQQTFTVGTGPYGIAAVDLNSDGHVDLAIGATNATAITLLTNTTAYGAYAASFAPATFATVAGYASSLHYLTVVNQSVLPPGSSSWSIMVANTTYNGIQVALSGGTGGNVPNPPLSFAFTAPVVVGNFEPSSVQQFEWYQNTAVLTPVNASILAASPDGTVVGNFPGYGVQLYRPGSGWVQLTPTQATSLAIDAQDDIVGNFPGIGVWMYKFTTGFRQLTPTNATTLGIDAYGNVVGNFPGIGVWLYRPTTSWLQITPTNATVLAMNAIGNIVGTFPNIGVWLYKPTTSWLQLTPVGATSLAINVNDVIVGNFTGYGVQKWTPTYNWVQLSQSNASLLQIDNTDHIWGEFQGYGVQVHDPYDGPDWTQAQPQDATSLALGDWPFGFNSPYEG